MQRVISITAKTAGDMEYELGDLNGTQVLEDGYPTGYYVDSIESFSIVFSDSMFIAFVLVNVYERED